MRIEHALAVDVTNLNLIASVKFCNHRAVHFKGAWSSTHAFCKIDLFSAPNEAAVDTHIPGDSRSNKTR